MKITAVETINLAEFPNVLWVQIHTDEGLVGLGETFYAVAPVAAMFSVMSAFTRRASGGIELTVRGSTSSRPWRPRRKSPTANASTTW